MQKESKLSIIVPIYNGEKYMNRMIRSIIEQTYSNIELILVDDGSLDSSLELCRSYEQNDDRIRVIHQVNSGESAARNTGIKHATGEYVAIFDQDDEIASNTFSALMRYANSQSPDVIRGNFCTHYGKRVVKNILEQPCGVLLDREYIVNEVIPYTIGIKNNESRKLQGHWTLITKRSLLHDNKILYDETMRKEDDHKFLVNILAYANSIIFDDGVYYHWIKRKGSNSSSYSPRFSNICKNFKFYQELFSSYYDFNNKDKIYYNIDFVLESVRYVIHHRNDCDLKVELNNIFSSNESREWFSLLQPRNRTEKRLKYYIDNSLYEKAARYSKYDFILFRMDNLRKKVKNLLVSLIR